jgi:hypothetical protein
MTEYHLVFNIKVDDKVNVYEDEEDCYRDILNQIEKVLI